MSLEEKLGQMVIVEFYGSTLNSDLQQMIQQSHISGVLIENKNGNAQTRAQLVSLNRAMQSAAHIPLLLLCTMRRCNWPDDEAKRMSFPGGRCGDVAERSLSEASRGCLRR
jgi:hypothetical protein